MVIDRQDNWDVYLDASLFSLRSKVHATTEFTPFMLMYGREAVFPSEVPVDVPHYSTALPDATTYGLVVDEKKKGLDNRKDMASANISLSQDYQKEAYARGCLKKIQEHCISCWG